MTTSGERFRRVAEGFTARVDAVPDGAWDDPAPPEGWTARDVVGHLIDWMSGLFFDTWSIPRPDLPSVADDPAGAWYGFRDAVQAALDDPTIADEEREIMPGRMTFAVAMDQIGTSDVFLHTWDLARATGGDERLDPDEVHALFVGMEPMDEMLRQSGHFGPRVPVPDDADEQTRLIAFIGRQPWDAPTNGAWAVVVGQDRDPDRHAGDESMASHDLTFGVFVPQGWKMELASIEDPQAKWAKAVEVAKLADDLGLDSLWVYDHFHNVPVPAHETMFECWTTLAAISQVTSRIKLGQMVGCSPYRNPGLLAKITSNIDVISGGRLIWGIGAGWYEHEFTGYGYDFPKASDRIRVLRETVEIVKAMWSEPDVSYEGRHFTLDGAQCDPKPVQQPHPEILIGGGGEQLTLRVVARHADSANFGGKPHEWQHKAEVLQRHCADIGRDYDEIRKTISPEVFIRETEQEILDAGSRSFWGEPAESWREGNLVGTPEQVAEKIKAYVDLGCTGFYPWCSDYPETETLRLFAQVAADLR